MSKQFISQWGLEKRFLPVSRRNFMEALDICRQEIEKATGAIPSVRLSFYKAAAPAPGFKTPPLICEIDNPDRVPFLPWHKAEAIVAAFSTAANSDIPLLEMKIRAKTPDYLGIGFEITEGREAGDKVARAILHDNETFRMWLPSMKQGNC